MSLQAVPKTPFDVYVCQEIGAEADAIQCVDMSINEDNTFLTLKSVTGRERTYCLAQVFWFER
jgi:excinuclease UvrABC helicase subunit UvrB